MKKLFTAATANDTTKVNAFEVTNDSYNGAPLVCHAFGTFDTCTLTLYGSLNGAADGIVLDTFTSAELVVLNQYPAGMTIWGELSSVGASTSVSLWIAGQGND